MLACWWVDDGINPHPVTHRSDLTERDTGLHHAEGPGIHPEKNHSAAGRRKAFDVLPVRGPGVAQRIIDMSDRGIELQSGQFGREPLCSLDQRL